MDPSKVLLHLLIGDLSEEVDVLMFNQELSFMAKRSLQAMGATDGLEGQSKDIFTPFTDHMFMHATDAAKQRAV